MHVLGYVMVLVSAGTWVGKAHANKAGRLFDVVMLVAQAANPSRLQHHGEWKGEVIMEPSFDKSTQDMTMAYQDDIALFLSMHIGSMEVPDLGDQVVKPGSDLIRDFSLLTSVTPDIPSSFSVESMLSPQRSNLMCHLALVQTIFPFC